MKKNKRFKGASWDTLIRTLIASQDKSCVHKKNCTQSNLLKWNTQHELINEFEYQTFYKCLIQCFIYIKTMTEQ